jgi:thiol-disulfide isomerase/thioredoxin
MIMRAKTHRRAVLGSLLAILLAAASPVHAGDVQPFVRGTWAEIAQAHKGRPLIVHLWGVTCAPCRVEMPEWGKLLAKKPAAPVVILHAERLPPDPNVVGDMLNDAGLAGADTWAFSETALSRLRYEIDPKWLGELPMTLLIDAEGNRRTIIGSADMAEVEAWIATQSPSR